MIYKFRSLTQSLADQIGFAIVNGDFSIRDKALTELDISRIYGVGRSVAREVVKILHAKGLLESHAKTGIKFTEMECWSLFDSMVLDWILRSKLKFEFLVELLEFQKSFQCEAARLAAINFRDYRGSNILSDAMLKLDNAVAVGGDIVNAESEILIAILVLSENPYFRRLHDLVRVAVQLKHSYLIERETESSVKGHLYRMTVSAIEFGDSALASMLVQTTIDSFLLELKSFKKITRRSAFQFGSRKNSICVVTQ